MGHSGVCGVVGGVGGVSLNYTYRKILNTLKSKGRCKYISLLKFSNKLLKEEYSLARNRCIIEKESTLNNQFLEYLFHVCII